jgi:hypothetical protein
VQWHGKTKTKGKKNMKNVLCAVLIASLAGLLPAAEIAGKFAFGYEQGIGVSDPSGGKLGQGCSFKLCLTNNVAIKGALGFNMSSKIEDITDPGTKATLYKEDKAKVDYTVAAYGIIVFRRFEKVHLNGMTGLLVAFRDNHFNKIDDVNRPYFTASGEDNTTTDFHLRILMAPEIFLFPNFSLEYKYGFDVAVKKETFPPAGSINPNNVTVEKSRLYINTIGDLDLLTSASVHFYF